MFCCAYALARWFNKAEKVGYVITQKPDDFGMMEREAEPGNPPFLSRAQTRSVSSDMRFVRSQVAGNKPDGESRR